MRWKHGTGSGCSLMAVLENNREFAGARDCRLVQHCVSIQNKLSRSAFSKKRRD